MLGVIVLAAAMAGGFAAVAPAPDEQPVADFSHTIHIARDIECIDCHIGVETHAFAGTPSITICADCHDDPEDTMGKTANGKRILDHIARKEDLWWPSLYYLPDHVVFSHRRHVTLGEVKCEQCHGDIAAATTLPKEPVDRVLTMKNCLACHARSGASQDCLACHR